MVSSRYEFRVAGRLSDRSRQVLDDLEVVDVPTETVLRGVVLDEAHLHGILAQLRSMGLRVVSMNEVPR